MSQIQRTPPRRRSPRLQSDVNVENDFATMSANASAETQRGTPTYAANAAAVQLGVQSNAANAVAAQLSVSTTATTAAVAQLGAPTTVTNAAVTQCSFPFTAVTAATAPLNVPVIATTAAVAQLDVSSAAANAAAAQLNSSSAANAAAAQLVSSSAANAAAAQFALPTNAATAAAAQLAIPVSAAAAAATNSEILNAMQQQIAALESQLKSAQVRLKESDLQCPTLKMALQKPAVVSLTHSPTVCQTAFAVSPPVSAAISSNFQGNPSSVSQPRQFPYSYAETQSTFMPTIYPLVPVTSDGQMPMYGAMDQPSVSSINSAMPQEVPIYQSNAMMPRKIQDLPAFSGLPEDWPMFYTAYIQSTAAYKYTNFENNQRLQRCLSGEARETVKSLLIHPDNVNAILNQLRFRFGRPEQLIRSQLSQVRDIAPIPEHAVVRLIPFATKTRNLAVFLQSVNAQQHLANPTLLEELISKLPMSKKMEWARCASKIQPYPTIIHFSEWLSDIANLVSTVQDTDCRDTKRRMPMLHIKEKQRSHDYKCALCHGHHKVIECKRIVDITVPERWTQVKRHRLCFTCLKPGHATRDCRSKDLCSINGCNRRHHELLHEERSQHKSSCNRDEDSGSTCTPSKVLAVNEMSNDELLFRVLPVTLYGHDKAINTYALFDEGSSVTMMDNDLLEELGLRGQQRTLSMQWVGGRMAQESAAVVDLYISGLGIKKKHKLRNVYGMANLNLPVQSVRKSDLQGDNAIKLPLRTFTNAQPKLLIGLDHSHLGLQRDFIRIKKDGPYATKTDLGWVIYGPNASTARKPPTCLLVNELGDQTLHALVEEYFKVESLGVRPAPPPESADDVRAKNLLQSTTTKTKGKFQTGLLWRSDKVVLPESYSMAKKRLIGIERKMRRDEEFAAAYCSIIKAYVEKNYARKLQPAEVAINNQKTWYLPHFAVVNPNKKGKLRLVFDAAAEVDGTSLNSCLLKGPQEYQSLPSVLFHFREGAVAVCGDIKEMFHQILIRPEDRCAQRFLWRNGDDGRPPDVYEMMVMTFGAACSPCAAQHVKTINALEHRSHHPRAVKSITNYHYVDDFVDSFESVEHAIEISSQVREIHQDAGFDLRNFTSNCPKVLQALKDKGATVSESAKSVFETEKVLGMYWQPASDNFNYQLLFHKVEKDVISGVRRPTKRELLSVIMSVFDPLGFLRHFTIIAKLLMREAWRREVGWDQPLPDEVFASWNKWRRQLERIADFKVPRFYFSLEPPKRTELHVFVDASEHAFAAVAYWRYVNARSEVSTAFICAKSKCAPLKSLTIPRLELQAAILGTRLTRTIMEEHSVHVSRKVLWCDSTTVLKWIASKHRRYKPFVAHRIAEILSSTDQSEWRWIPTLENVADEATRPNSNIDFQSSSRWLRGPEFLLSDESSWPTSVLFMPKDEVEDNEELRPKYALVVVSIQLININRFSSLNRLVRTIAWVLRFVSRCRKLTSRRQNMSPTASELYTAELQLCRQAQYEAFKEEIQQIKNNEAVKKGSALYQLSPYIDNDGVLRVNGRVDAANWLPYSARRPAILPSTHPFTNLVLVHFHSRMKHQNTEATICEIRRKYWIPRIRQALRKAVANCRLCRITKAAPVTPLMGPLPEDRLTPFVRPFSYTGLDYFGPLSVTIGRRTEKRWVALFTCLTVRAIHLEVVHDLSTDACIVAIRNFVNRRGVPVRIRSDNGTNFVGVHQEMKRFSEVFDCEQVQNELSSKGIEWIFSCPSNPSEGGVWERLVQCVKRALYHTLKEVSPREHTLQCLIIEAENVVNSRPLTHLPITPDQDEPLTPNHFLLGSANTAQTPGVNEGLKQLCALRKQWRIARQLRDRFWKRWINEYLPTLTRRTKWCQSSKPIAEGDLVFVCDVNLPRKLWSRGRVERVYPGVDGEVRRADVRTQGNNTTPCIEACRTGSREW